MCNEELGETGGAVAVGEWEGEGGSRDLSAHISTTLIPATYRHHPIGLSPSHPMGYFAYTLSGVVLFHVTISYKTITKTEPI